MDIEQTMVQELYTELPCLKSFLHEVHWLYGILLMGLEIKKYIAFCGGYTTLIGNSKMAMEWSDYPPFNCTLFVLHYDFEAFWSLYFGC
jgi:hypothetical protein